MGAERRCRRRKRRMDGHEVERLLAVERYRRGEAIAAICVSLKRSRSWFFKWLRPGDHEERAWYEEQSRRRHDTGGCAEDLRTEIIQTRGRLEAAGTFVSAQMIAWELEDQKIEPPSISTIKRILKAAGLTVPKRRMPKGTKYPAPLAIEPGAVHQFDFVGPRYAGGKRFYLLNGVDLATGRAAAEPVQSRATEHVIPGLWNVWTRMGIPSILQLDNELVFFGNRRYPSAAGQVMRLCFAAGVELVSFRSGSRGGMAWSRSSTITGTACSTAVSRCLRSTSFGASRFSSKAATTPRGATRRLEAVRRMMLLRSPQLSFAFQAGRHLLR